MLLWKFFFQNKKFIEAEKICQNILDLNPNNFDAINLLAAINFQNKSFAIYGLGLTGKSVIKFLKKNKVKKIFTWDDYKTKTNYIIFVIKIIKYFRHI